LSLRCSLLQLRAVWCNQACTSVGLEPPRNHPPPPFGADLE